MEGILFAPALSLSFALFLRAKVSQYFQGGTPTLELHFPVNDDCCWYDDQVWPPNSSVTGK